MENEIEKVEVNPLALAMDVEFEAMKASQPVESGMEWLPDWYTKQVGNIEDARQRIKAQADKMMADLERAEMYLSEKWETQLRAEIDRQFASGKAGKKKTIQNMYGSIGYREVAGRTSLEITDEQAAIDFLSGFTCGIQNALVQKIEINKTLVKKHMEETGEDIPGCKLVTGETYQKFTVKPTPLTLEKK